MVFAHHRCIIIMKVEQNTFTTGFGQENPLISKPMGDYFFSEKRLMKWYGSEKVGRSQFYTSMLEMFMFYFILFFLTMVEILSCKSTISLLSGK